MEGITIATVNKEQKARHFENHKYDFLENSGNILFGNSSLHWFTRYSDLHFYHTDIQNLNTSHLTYCLMNVKFSSWYKDENLYVLYLNIRSSDKNFENLKMFYRI